MRSVCTGYRIFQFYQALKDILSMEEPTTLPMPRVPQTTKRLAPTSPESLALRLEARLDDTTNEANVVDDTREDRRDEEDMGSEEGNTPVYHAPEADDEETRDTEKTQTEEDKRETEKPLMEDEKEKSLDDKDSIKIEITEGKGSTDVIDRPPTKKAPKYLFPITRMRLAWTKSSNICEFLLKATFIIFSTLGWLFCVGGIPFVSLAMLIMGSVYKDDCKFQPNIPIYLIVAGALGTIQHFTAVCTNYLPKQSQGRVRLYRAYCRVFDAILQLFLLIWFVLGCIWVYGIFSKVVYEDTYKDEYCNKSLYLFAFWILNLSFIVLALLIVFSFCIIVCIVGSDK